MRRKREWSLDTITETVSEINTDRNGQKDDYRGVHRLFVIIKETIVIGTIIRIKGALFIRFRFFQLSKKGSYFNDV